MKNEVWRNPERAHPTLLKFAARSGATTSLTTTVTLKRQLLKIDALKAMPAVLTAHKVMHARNMTLLVYKDFSKKPPSEPEKITNVSRIVRNINRKMRRRFYQCSAAALVTKVIKIYRIDP